MKKFIQTSLLALAFSTSSTTALAANVGYQGNEPYQGDEFQPGVEYYQENEFGQDNEFYQEDALCQGESPFVHGILHSNTCKNGFYIGVNGTWAIPTETGIGTFIDNWQYNNGGGQTLSRSKPSHQHYKGAGGFKVGYDFECSANNIEFEYFHLSNRKHNVHGTADDPTSFASPFFNLWIPLPIPGTVLVSDSHLKYKLDQADLKVGHHLTTGCTGLKLLPTAGLRYIKAEHDLTFLYGYVRSEYHGIGPVFGLDADYEFWNGFSFVSHFDASALMGTVNAHSLLNAVTNNKYTAPSVDRIVYAFSGKLGLTYDYQFCNRSSLKFEVGYRVHNYIGPFDIIQAFTDPTPRIGTLNTTNFGYSGPYIELTWHM